MNLRDTLKKYLIPHKENDFAPHFLRDRSVSIVIAVVFMIELTMIGQSLILSKNSGFLADVLPAVLVNLTNADRNQNAVGNLTVSPALTAAAQLKANDMAAKGYFSHKTPEGFEPWHFLDEVGYSYSYAGENLAVNFFDSADVERAWMNSPGHRENLVKPEYTEVGIAMANGTYKGKDTIFVVQFFGTPKIATIPVPGTQITPTPVAAIPTKVASRPAVKPALIAAAAPTQLAEAPIILDNELAEVKAAATQGVKSPSPSLLKRLLTSPREMDKWLLGSLLAIVAAALGFAVLIEVKVQHKHIIANGLGLMIVIAIGFMLNFQIFAGNVNITPTDSASASVINSFDPN